MPNIRSLLGILAVLAGVGCSSVDAPVAKYAKATLTSGAGLGDLALGRTTLDQFVRTVGKGQFMLAVSDESAFEFRFHGNQLAVQFLIAGECDRQIAATRDLHEAIRLDEYLASHPACRDLRLTSISVGADRSSVRPFFTGATEHGARLGDVITATAEHGPTKPAMPRMVAGLSKSNPENVIESPGILFYYDADASGKIEDTAIRRMTIFVDPDSISTDAVPGD